MNLTDRQQTIVRCIARLGVALLFTFCLLIAPVAAAANLTNLGNVTLGWDRSPDDLLTNGVIYKIYSSTNGVNQIVAYTGTNISVTLTNIQPAMWTFYATANQGGLESDPSNVVIYSVPALKPRPPGKMFVIYMQATFNYTNFTDMGAGFRGILNVYP